MHPVRATVLLVAVVLSACATQLPPLASDYSPASGEAIVVGRIIGFEPRAYLFGKPTMTITVKHAATRAKYDIRGEQEGHDTYFSVALPAGHYTLAELKQGNLVASPPVQFDVAAGAITYVGTLRYTSAGLGKSILASMGGSPTMPGTWTVEDDHAGASARFREQHPNLSQEIAKSLMELGR